MWSRFNKGFKYLKNGFLKIIGQKTNDPVVHIRGHLRIRSHTPLSNQPVCPGNDQAHIFSWNNKIHTSRYTWWNFIFLNFISQIVLPSNIYFIAMAALQLIPAISDSDQMPTFLVPLGIVMFISAIKDIFEDFRRYKADNLENHKTCHVFREGKLVEAEWKYIYPGDIIKLFAEDAVPADMVLLGCSDPDGVAFIETMQLDGETSLKHKTCIPALAEICSDDSKTSKLKLEVEIEQPTEQLYQFSGVATIYEPDFKRLQKKNDKRSIEALSSTFGWKKRLSAKSDSSLHSEDFINSKNYNLDVEQFLWRGTSLAYTKWAYGMVVYVGHKTKLLKNSKTRSLKRCRSRAYFNNCAYCLVILQMVLCCIGAIVAVIQTPNLRANAWYLSLGSKSNLAVTFFLAMLQYMLLTSYFVPLTVLVQLDFTSLFQSFFLAKDKMMSVQNGTVSATAQSVSLIDELGGVTHLFSDKTGTLTQNIMQLKCLGIGDSVFGLQWQRTTSPPDIPLDKPPTSFYTMEQPNIHLNQEDVRRSPNKYVDFDAASFRNVIDEASENERYEAQLFLLVLSLCHSVLPKAPCAGSVDPGSFWKMQTKTLSLTNRSSKKLIVRPFNNFRTVLFRIRMFFAKYRRRASSKKLTCMVQFKISPQKSADKKYYRSRLISSKSVEGIKVGVWYPILEPNYEASSPDELALAEAAKHIGIEFIRRPSLKSIELAITNEIMEALMLSERDRQEVSRLRALHNERFRSQAVVPFVTYEILDILAFDNDRKRMSVIIRNRNGDMQLICKGADSSMCGVAEEGQGFMISRLKTTLTEFAARGLRTLVFGIKNICDSEYAAYIDAISLARLRTDREEKEIAIRKAFEIVETGIKLLGCTGVEDKLQEQVAEVIQDIKSAGIKLWVLTGDKLETAISIGHSCNILTENTYNAIIDGTDTASVMRQLEQCMNYIFVGYLLGDAFPVNNLLNNKKTQKNKPEKLKKLFDTVPFIRKRNKIESPKMVVNSVSESRQRRTVAWNEFVDLLEEKAHESRTEGKLKRKRRLSSSFVRSIIDSYLNTFGFNEFDKFNSLNPLMVDPVRMLNIDLWSLVPQKTIGRMNLTIRNRPISQENVCNTDFGNDITSEMSENNVDEGGGQCSIEQLQSNVFNRKIDDTLNNCPIAEENPEYSVSNKVFQNELFPNFLNKKHNSLDGTMEREVEQYQMCAVTVTGDALSAIFDESEITRYFFALANLCNCVIACRVSPKQKAEIISKAKSFDSKLVALAVGDGANDVGMLITANIGVGIRGQEGLQAVRASDFSIPRFRFLKNLLFVHGKEALRRNSFQLYHTICKCIIFGSADFFFGIVSAFSGTDIFNRWLKQLFSLFYTTIPVVLFSTFDRHLDYEVLMSTPPLYPSFNQAGYALYLNGERFWRWITYSLFAAVVCVFLPAYCLSHQSFISNGVPSTADFYSYGVTVFGSIVIVSNLLIIPFVGSWFWFIAFSILFDIILWHGSWTACSFMAVDNLFCPDLRHSIKLLFLSPKYQFTLILTITLALFPHILIWLTKIMFRPTSAMIIRERISKGVFDVVLAPTSGMNALSVMVPKTYQEWTGYAFAEESRFWCMNRFRTHSNDMSDYVKHMSDKVSESNLNL